MKIETNILKTKRINQTKINSEADSELLNNNENSYFGEMTYKCKWCCAFYWKEEKSKSNCCSSGKIVLSPLSKYDNRLKNLLLYDKTFRSLIRYYNSLHSFLTFNAKVKYNNNQQSVYNLTIQGEISHSMPISLIPKKDKEPICGQLYILDDDTAVQKRVQTDKKLIKEHLEIINSVMKNNPFCKKHRCLHQLSNISNLPNYKIYFMRKNKYQNHTYNKPLTSDCAAIIVTDGDKVPEDYDVCVYPKNNKIEKTYINKLSHFVDPMRFPLLFPAGDLGWSIGYSKRPEKKSEKLTLLQHYSYRMAFRPNHISFNPFIIQWEINTTIFYSCFING